MNVDPYTAVWVSHTSIGDFLRCPRAYFLRNVYRHPVTGHRVNIMTPALALGQTVHGVLESLSSLPADKRFAEPLLQRFELLFEKVSGKRGGFVNTETENQYKNRGREMLRRIVERPGPLENLAVKITMDLPHFWLSEEDNIILCGKIDWIEYLPDTDSVHIIDFKTGQREEDSRSLQLPIYHLLASRCQKRRVTRVSYWFLGRPHGLVEQPLPDVSVAQERLLKIAKKIKLARQLQKFSCPQKSGCAACRPLEAVVRGEATLVGTDDFGQDVYIIERAFPAQDQESVIL